MDFFWSLFGMGSKATATHMTSTASTSSAQKALEARVNRYIQDFLGSDRPPSDLNTEFNRFKAFVSMKSKTEKLPQIDDNTLSNIVQAAIGGKIVSASSAPNVQQTIDAFTQWLGNYLGKPGMAQYVKDNKLQNIYDLTTLNKAVKGWAHEAYQAGRLTLQQANAIEGAIDHFCRAYGENYIPSQQDVRLFADACSQAKYPLCFYTVNANPLTGFLSNFSEVAITFNTITYKCAEGAFQAQKLAYCSLMDPNTKQWYLQQFQIATGDGAYQLSKKLKTEPSFDSKGWDLVKRSAMQQILAAKFSNPTLGALLVCTGDAYLCERPVDNPKTGQPVQNRGRPWTDNGDATGENWLGEDLMALRLQLHGVGIVPKPAFFANLQARPIILPCGSTRMVQ